MDYEKLLANKDGIIKRLQQQRDQARSRAEALEEDLGWARMADDDPEAFGRKIRSRLKAERRRGMEDARAAFLVRDQQEPAPLKNPEPEPADESADERKPVSTGASRPVDHFHDAPPAWLRTGTESGEFDLNVDRLIAESNARAAQGLPTRRRVQGGLSTPITEPEEVTPEIEPEAPPIALAPEE